MSGENAGVNIEAHEVVIAGNVVGRDNIVVIVNAPTPPSHETFPSQVAAGAWPALQGKNAGRTAELTELQADLRAGRGVILWGPTGIGKTRLALQLGAAHAAGLARAYLDLHGEALPSAQKLAEIAAQARQAFALAGSSSAVSGAERPLLLILDNAGDAPPDDAVWPPEGCRVIVTARHALVLTGLRTCRLAPFTPAEAVAFLRALEYPNTAYAVEIEAHAGAIAAACGGLPFVLEHAAGAFAHRPPGIGAADWIRRLAFPPAGRAPADEAMLRALTAQAARLPPADQPRWRQLALLPVPSSPALAGALWGVTEVEAGFVLDALWHAGLLEHAGGDRWHLHEITRRLLLGDLAPELRSAAERNLLNALDDPARRPALAVFLADCLFVAERRREAAQRAGASPPEQFLLGRVDPALEQKLESVLSQMLSAEGLHLPEQRTAAFWLIRLHWLGRLGFPALEVCLDLVGRFVSDPGKLEYLAAVITQALNTNPTDQQRATLLVHRGAKLGALGRLPEAEADYLAALPRLAGSNRRLAQACLGLGNIALFRCQAAPEADPSRGAWLQQAETYYRLGEGFARQGKPDESLQVTLLGQMSKAQALLKNWPAARQAYQSAFDTLRQWRARLPADELEDYTHYCLWALEKAGLTRELEAADAQARGQTAAARHSYWAALGAAEKIIHSLEKSPAPEALVVAYNNAGRMLMSLRDLGGLGSQAEAALLARACACWRAAERLAGQFGLEDDRGEAQAYLEKHCAALPAANYPGESQHE
jgi:hypothetical protein